MKTLTKAEEQVMHAVWKIREGFIRDIMDAMPIPKPHQNTVATLLKILIEKEFIAIRIFGRQHQY
jgi:BlaI family penicillinase repressor